MIAHSVPTSLLVLFFCTMALGPTVALGRPPNDLCADATDLSASSPDHNCDGQISDPDLGTCTVQGNSLHEICSVSAQDCDSCIANCCMPRTAGTDAYRCLVTNVDNRLATCECPPNVPTGGTPNQQNTACNSGGNAFQRDVWYQYTAPCTGRMTITECGLPGFDAMLMVYSNDTPTCTCNLSNAAVPPSGFANDRACNDDFCSTSGTSAVALPVIKDNCYLIRNGGYSQAGGDSDAGAGITQMDIGVLCDLPPLANPALAVTTGQLACKKNRHICFQTNNASQEVAFEIRRTSAPAMTGYAGPPDANGVSGVYPGPPVAANFRNNWPAVLCVGDCEIIPVANYEVRTIPGPAPGGAPTAPLVVQTIPAPAPKFFGDTTGGLVAGAWDCPNGVVNTNDFQMAIQKFLGAPTAPHNTMSNIQAVSSTDPCLNAATNIADVFLILKAYQGVAYPFIAGTTANCPPNTGGANCPP